MGRGKSEKNIELIVAARVILEEIQPATVRAVCYRLFTMGLIPNMSRNSTNRVSAQLVYARETGIIPWHWVVDETREAERARLWQSTNEIIDAAVRGYRRDYWQEQAHWVEVWSENGTVRGTLAPVLNKYGVTFRVMHGYGSATAINQIAEETLNSDKPLTVFYVGDYDCSGMNMSEVDLPSRLARYNGEATIKRIALTNADIKTGLPYFDADTKAGDPRYKWFVQNYGNRCWELDAMPPPALRQRVEEAIVEMIDLDAWHRAISIETKEVESMQNFAASWKTSISRLASK